MTECTTSAECANSVHGAACTLYNATLAYCECPDAVFGGRRAAFPRCTDSTASVGAAVVFVLAILAEVTMIRKYLLLSVHIVCVKRYLQRNLASFSYALSWLGMIITTMATVLCLVASQSGNIVELSDAAVCLRNVVLLVLMTLCTIIIFAFSTIASFSVRISNSAYVYHGLYGLFGLGLIVVMFVKPTRQIEHIFAFLACSYLGVSILMSGSRLYVLSYDRLKKYVASPSTHGTPSSETMRKKRNTVVRLEFIQATISDAVFHDATKQNLYLGLDELPAIVEDEQIANRRGESSGRSSSKSQKLSKKNTQRFRISKRVSKLLFLGHDEEEESTMQRNAAMVKFLSRMIFMTFWAGIFFILAGIFFILSYWVVFDFSYLTGRDFFFACGLVSLDGGAFCLLAFSVMPFRTRVRTEKTRALKFSSKLLSREGDLPAETRVVVAPWIEQPDEMARDFDPKQMKSNFKREQPAAKSPHHSRKSSLGV